MVSRSLVVTVLVLMTLGAPTAAHADPASDASAHHRAAISYAKSGKWADAVRELVVAYELDPTPIRLYDVAQARLQAKQYVAARDAYAKVVDSAALSPGQRERARAGLETAKRSIGKLRVSVMNAQSADVITVDDVRMRKDVLEVDPGPRVVRLVRGGTTIAEETVDVPIGGESDVVLSAPTVVNEDASKPPPADEEKAAPPRAGVPAAGFILGGLAVAAIGAGAYLWITGKSEYDAVKDTGCAPRCGDREDPGREKALVGDVFMAAGVITGALATYLIVSSLTSKSTVRTRPRPVEVGVAPLPSSGGVGLRGEF